MKKAAVLILLVLSLCAFDAPYFATTVELCEEITIGTTATEYVVDVTYLKLTQPQTFYIVTDAANSGTIQFSVGHAPDASQRAVGPDERVIIQGVQNGFRNIWADGSASGQKFTIH